MKKICLALVGVFLLSTGVFAETLEAEQDYVVYDQQNQDNNSGFFVGIESGLFSYDTVKISNSVLDVSTKTNTLNLNYGILDDVSLLFGFETNRKARFAFKIAQRGVETDDSDVKIEEYSLRADIPIIRNQIVIPFARLGVGYVSAEDGADDISTAVFMLGFGGTYYISRNVFTYALLQYAFTPKTDMSNNDFKYQEAGFGLMVGLGYKF